MKKATPIGRLQAKRLDPTWFLSYRLDGVFALGVLHHRLRDLLRVVVWTGQIESRDNDRTQERVAELVEPTFCRNFTDGLGNLYPAMHFSDPHHRTPHGISFTFSKSVLLLQIRRNLARCGDDGQSMVIVP